MTTDSRLSAASHKPSRRKCLSGSYTVTSRREVLRGISTPGWRMVQTVGQFKILGRSKQVKKDEKHMRASLLSWISPCEVAHCTNCCSYFEGRFPGACTERYARRRKTNLYLVTNTSGLKAQPSAQLDQMCFRITNWKNLFPRFCHCGTVLMERFLGQVLATRLRDLGQYCGCHGHSEGNSPVSRRWTQ